MLVVVTDFGVIHNHVISKGKKIPSDNTSQNSLYLVHERLNYLNQESVKFMFRHVFNSTKNMIMPVNYRDSIMFGLRLNEEILQVGAIQTLKIFISNISFWK